MDSRTALSTLMSLDRANLSHLPSLAARTDVTSSRSAVTNPSVCGEE